MDKKIRVAIDGPSGAGKSTIAKAVAAAMGLDYIDTGAMYRAVGYKVLRQNIDPKDDKAMQKMLKETEIDFSEGNIILDGQVINDKIRTAEISQKASQCSSIPAVREKLVQLQRKMAETKSVIMDGRDIGTNVLKDAEYKFFMTASPEERAQRRYDELKEKGQNVVYEQVLEDMIQRDHTDMTRALNPLCKASDAVEIDTTGMGIQDVIDYIQKEIEK